MRVVLQIVDQASVEIEKKVISKIAKGYLLLVGIVQGDNEDNVIKMADKISKLRVFKDESDKTNLSLKDVKGSILSVSQFTLCADISKGNRPSFVNSAKREDAIRLYELFNKKLKELGFEVQTGNFGADMKVSLINDGPFTLFVEN